MIEQFVDESEQLLLLDGAPTSSIENILLGEACVFSFSR